jgi:peptide/nickel transport system permease protein
MALARGELGWSWSRSMPVGRALAAALPATLLLSGAALLIHVLAGVAIGVTAAARRGRLPDRILTLSTLALWSMPTFWVGLMAILALAYGLPVFPPSSMRSVGAAQLSLPARALDVLWHLCLPAFVLGISSAAATARFIRAGLVQTLDEEFVRAARARGLGGRRVLLVHALRNALLPVINILVSGSLVVEVVFAWPGMGRLTYDAILAQDVPLVLATTLLASVMVIAGSLLADLAMAAVDPRIRVAPRGAGS